MPHRFKILLATDYSQAVMNAERYAIEFARYTNSILIFFHVCSEKQKPNKEVELKRLDEHRKEMFKALNIENDQLTYECVLGTGDIEKQVHEYAENLCVDFIVIGTHGATGFREVFFGSHSWNLINKSNLPVLAIPEHALFTGIKHIVFGTEYREGEIAILNFLVQFAKHFSACITVVHTTNYILTKSFEEEIFEKFRAEVAGKISYQGLQMKLVADENIPKGLNTFCEQNKVDMLIVSPERPFLLKKLFGSLMSVSKKMTLYSSVPIMAIPDFYNPDYFKFWKNFSYGDRVNEEF